jgi:outer membrane biosynthesis protein TonB
MNKCLFIFILSVTLSAWAQDVPDLPYDVAPWPVGDSLKMPDYPQMAKIAGVPGKVEVILLVNSKVVKLDVQSR